MKSSRFVLVVGGCVLLLVGCRSPHGPGNETANAVDGIFGSVRQQVDPLKQAQDGMSDAYSNRLATLERASQFAADRVDAARQANQQSGQTNGYARAIASQLDHASRALPLPSASAPAENDAVLALTLSAAEADQSRLAATNQALRAEAEKLQAETIALDNDITQKQRALAAATQRLENEVSRGNALAAATRVKAAAARDAAAAEAKVAAQKTRMRIATVFMILGGLILIGGVVATYLHVPGVLMASVCAGGASLALGLLITFLDELFQKLWFQITAGALVFCGTLAGGIWIFIKARETRRTAKLDAQISNSTIAAIQELRNDDERFGLSRFDDTIKPYLEAWHTTVDGIAHPEVRREIDQRLVHMNLRDCGRKTNAIVQPRKRDGAASRETALPQRTAVPTAPAPSPSTGTGTGTNESTTVSA